MGVVAMALPRGLGPQDPTKNWPYRWNFWVNRYLENMFSKFLGLIKGAGVGGPSTKVYFHLFIVSDRGEYQLPGILCFKSYIYCLNFYILDGLPCQKTVCFLRSILQYIRRFLI